MSVVVVFLTPDSDGGVPVASGGVVFVVIGHLSGGAAAGPERRAAGLESGGAPADNGSGGVLSRAGEHFFLHNFK